jgi:hypothetical protein
MIQYQRIYLSSNMKLRFLLVVSFCLYLFSAQAQNPGLEIRDVPSAVCLHSQMNVATFVIGEFASGNSYYAEFSTTGDNNALIARYPAFLRDGLMTFQVDDDKLAGYTNILFRIAATSPVAKSNYAQINVIHTRGTLVLASDTKPDTLNSGERFGLKLTNTANNPVTVTLNDSSRFVLGNSVENQQIFLRAQKSDDIFIVRAENSCGVAVPFSGRSKVHVNPLSIVPARIISRTVCAGSEIEVGYAVTGGVIPESTKFRLRFVAAYDYENKPKSFEMPVVKKADGMLSGMIPANAFPGQLDQSFFKLAIITESPGLVSPFSEQFMLYPKPGAQLTSQSGNIQPGDWFQVSFQVTAPGPYTLELNNGRTYSNYYGGGSIQFYPQQTETFTIKSLKTQCGVTADFPKQSVVATVAPGIMITGERYKRIEICENQKLRLPFATNVVFNASTKYYLEGSSANGKAYEFEAKLINDSLEIFIPHSPEEWLTEGYFDITQFRAKTVNPSYTSIPVYGFTIRGIPRVSYSSYFPTALPYPQNYEYVLHVTGGVPYEMTGPKDEEVFWDANVFAQRTFFRESGSYQPKFIRNVCYSTDKVAPLNYTVGQFPAGSRRILVEKLSGRTYFCDTDSVAFRVDTVGVFNGASLDVYLTSGNRKVMTIPGPGIYKVPASLMDNSYNYIYVRCENPDVTSEWSTSIVKTGKPEINPFGMYGTKTTAELPSVFGPDEVPSLNWGIVSKIPYSMDFSGDGTTYQFKKNLFNEVPFVRPSKSIVSTYTLKSVTNSCGTTFSDINYYVFWKEYNIKLAEQPDNRVYCEGERLALPFSIVDGNAPSGTKFHLQIKQEDEKEFRTLETISAGQNEFAYVVQSLPVQRYQVRVLSEHGVYSDVVLMSVKHKPTAIIRAADSYPKFTGEINAGERVELEYVLTGGEPYNVIPAGNANLSYSGANFVLAGPVSSTIYQIQSVSNECGYGTVSGSVPVRVKPVIKNFKILNNGLCYGNSIVAKYEVEGDLAAGEKVGFFLSMPNGDKIELGSYPNKSLTAALSLPSSLDGDNYKITCYITNSDQRKEEWFALSRNPDIEITGQITIRPGENTALEIRSTRKGNREVKVTISNGATISYNFWSGTERSYIPVAPEVTTTYTIVSAASVCGQANFKGSATVTVNSSSNPSVSIVSVGGSGFSACERDTIPVYFTTTGVFQAANVFRVKAYDSQGNFLRDLPTVGQESPLKVVLPEAPVMGESFRLRIVTSDVNVFSGDYLFPASLKRRSSASFAQSAVVPDISGDAKIVVKLEGEGPWRYRYGNDIAVTERWTSLTSDTINVQVSGIITYKLLSVSDGCGPGTITEPSTVKIEPILGTETSTETVKFGPNPTSGELTIWFENPASRTLLLYNKEGKLMRTDQVTGDHFLMDIRHLSSGDYLLQIKKKNQTGVYRILKDG